MLYSKASFDANQWNDWRFHMENLIRTKDQLAKWIEVTADEEGAIEAIADNYLWMITPYYASLMDKHNIHCPIRRQAIPHLDEMRNKSAGDIDPVGDTLNMKTRRVIHKYPNRVVMLVSDTCPVYCRHCTRKFHTTDVRGTYFKEGFDRSYDSDFAYIRSHPEIDDVLLTGGDPLFLSDGKLEHIIRTLREIPHISIIRIGTRYPVFLPQRITEEFCSMLSRYHPIWVSTHFNHPVEITDEAAAACDRLLRHGIPVQNQTVLLKSVNDDVEVMRSLVKALVGIRVRPYYLYHCDNVTGVSHFSTRPCWQRGSGLKERSPFVLNGTL
ncbi:KamA family radical SAM protein [Azospirillum endophyticum]